MQHKMRPHCSVNKNLNMTSQLEAESPDKSWGDPWEYDQLMAERQKRRAERNSLETSIVTWGSEREEADLFLPYCSHSAQLNVGKR